LGREYVFARKYDEAITQFRQALQLDSQYLPAVDALADAYARKGMYSEAGALQVRLLNLRQQTSLATQFESLHRTAGYPAAARMLDQKALDAYLRRPPENNSWNVAFTYARLGDHEAAFRWLEKAYAVRDPGLLLMRVDPDVDNLRSDPRFDVLQRRMGFPR
jgi:tetratricopeptide (TPR) repeat protein